MGNRGEHPDPLVEIPSSLISKFGLAALIKQAKTHNQKGALMTTDEFMFFVMCFAAVICIFVVL